MTRPSPSFPFRPIMAIGFTLLYFAVGSNATSHASTVFLTADPSISDSNLYRFDAGVQTFSVGVSSSDAFQGVTIHNNTVLVAEYLQNKIQSFSLTGTYLGAFATLANAPLYLESDSGGNIYTTPGVLGPSMGSRLNSLGSTTQTFSGTGEFTGIDADATGNVYIARVSGATRELLKYASNGTFINSTSLGTINPSDLAIDEVGKRLFIADQSSSGAGIKIFDISGVAPVPAGSFATPATARIIGIHYANESGHIFGVDFGVLSNDERGLEYSGAGALLAEYRPTATIQAWDVTTIVPEPTSIYLLIAGAASFVVTARKQRGR